MSDLSLDKCLQHWAKKNLALSRRGKNEKSGTGNLGKKIGYNIGHGSLRVHEIQETSQKNKTDLPQDCGGFTSASLHGSPLPAELLCWGCCQTR